MKKIILVLVLLMIAAPVSAKDIEITTNELLQNEFDSFVAEFGAALSFNPMAPAEPLGITGFDIAAEVILTDISENKGYWTKLIEANNPHPFLPMPRLHITKGLPFRIDIGAIYSYVPDTNIKLWGIELKYALLEGSMLTPALSIRGSHSQLSGVDDIDLNTQSLDLMISKGFLMLTPYAAVSALWVHGSENSDLVNLGDVDKTLFRALLGIQISPFPLFAINAEASFGEVIQYGFKVSIRF